MNFADIAKKLQQQAEKASLAAKNFKGFDDMAAQDDYIHSDSLNVKRKEHVYSQTKPLGQLITSSVLSLAGKPANATASTSRQTSSRSKKSTMMPPMMPSSDARNIGQGHAPLLSVVADTMKASSRLHEERQVMEDRSSDSESDDEDDPVLQQITRQRKTNQPKTKRNRFMDDLEDRISKDITPLPLVVHETTEIDKQPTSWISGLLGRKSDDRQTSTEMAPLTRKKRMETLSAPETDFTVVVSSSVLQADELAELHVLKSAAPRWFESVTLALREHPREAFIILTLLLCMFAYLRGRLAADDVH